MTKCTQHKPIKVNKNGSCCACAVIRAKKWKANKRAERYKKDPDYKKRVDARRKGSTPEDRRKYKRDWLRRWKKNNPELAKIKKKASRDPELNRIYNNSRRARKLQATGKHTVDDVSRLYFSQQGKCVGCAISLGNGYHVDHKTPLSRGGSNWPRNLQLLCQPCNDSKGARTMREWRRAA